MRDKVGKSGSAGRRRDPSAVKKRSCAGQQCAEKTRCKGQEEIRRKVEDFTHSGARQLLSLIGGFLLLLGQLDLHLTKSAGMDSCIIAVLVICSLTAPAFGDKGTSKARSCSDIRLFYSGKGFAPDGVPPSEISGKPSRVRLFPSRQIQLNVHSPTISRTHRRQSMFNTLTLLRNHNLATGPHRNVGLFWGQSCTCSRWRLLSTLGAAVEHTRMTQICRHLWDWCYQTRVHLICGRCKQRNSEVSLWMRNTNGSKRSELWSACSPHRSMLSSCCSPCAESVLLSSKTSYSAACCNVTFWCLTVTSLSVRTITCCAFPSNTRAHTRTLSLQFQILKLPSRRATPFEKL